MIKIGIGDHQTGVSNFKINRDGIIEDKIKDKDKVEEEVDHHHGRGIMEIKGHLIGNHPQIRTLIHQ